MILGDTFQRRQLALAVSVPAKEGWRSVGPTPIAYSPIQSGKLTQPRGRGIVGDQTKEPRVPRRGVSGWTTRLWANRSLRNRV